MRLRNKAVVVTGRRLEHGQGHHRVFAREGARVLAVAMGTKRLEELAARGRDYGGRDRALRGRHDVKADIEGMIDEAVRRFGRVDVLINNAGLMDDYSPGGRVRRCRLSRRSSSSTSGLPPMP